jgi:enoyl-CoA hydratase
VRGLSGNDLRGEIFSPAEADAPGLVHELVPARQLLDRAVAVAGQTPEDCLEQYAFTKRASLAMRTGVTGSS